MKHTLLHRRPRNPRAITLIEAIAVVAVIGIIASIAIPYTINARHSAQEARLTSTVAQINQSLKLYRANGGSIAGVTDPQQILDQMKTRRATDAAARYAGFSGTTVDPRLQVVLLDQDEVASPRLRAVWNADKQAFELTTDAVAGIADFVLVESAGQRDYGTEVREDPLIALNTEDGWIWNYDEADTGTKETPSPVNMSGTEPTGVTGTATSGGGGGGTHIIGLRKPEFSLATGYFSLQDFPLTLTLSNPNSGTDSQIFYRRGREGAFEEYSGEALSVGLDERVYAYVKSLNVSRYRDSAMNGEHYDGKPLDLELDLSSTKTSYSYFDLNDGQAKATARVTNLSEIPSSMLSDVKIAWAFGEDDALSGATGQELAGQIIPLSTSVWGEEGRLVLKAVAEGSGAYLKSSGEKSLCFDASVISLNSPVVEAVQEERGRFTVTLQTAGRVPGGTRIYYRTDGVDPVQNNETGSISGSAYESSFELRLQEDPTQTGATPYVGPSGAVTIKQVTLRYNNQDVVQNSSASSKKVNNSNSGSAELKSMKINQNSRDITLSYLNVLESTIRNVVYPDSTQDVSIYRAGSRVVRSSDASFATQLTTTMKSANLRDYLVYGTPSTNLPQHHLTFDIMFAPLTNGDFLIVSERNGDQSFSLTPLRWDGNPIAGANTVTISTYPWNTGYAPGDKKTEPFCLAAIDIEQFGVNTDKLSISGFRVQNTSGADIKFYTASDTTFASRKAKKTVAYLPSTVVARAFPPAALSGWFDPSQAARTELRDDSKTVRVDFNLLSSSAGYLNAATLYVNGIAYDFGNSDMGAGHQLSVDIEVNPFTNNRFDIAIDTWMRHGDWIHGLDTRDGTGFDLIGANASFQGASSYVAKIKDLSLDSQIHMIVGYEDLICTGGNPDWDYNDFLFEFHSEESFNFLFGGVNW